VVHPLDVLLVLRSCAEHYPPTVSQANLLAEHGLRIGMIDLSAGDAVDALHASIRRWRVHRMWNSKAEAPYPFWKRWIHWLRFFQTCRSVMRSAQPRVVIAYDTLGIAFVPPVPGRHRTVYHFHELPEPDPREGPGPTRARAKTARFARRSDLIVFSDATRARMYQESIGLKERPLTVMNCPRRLQQVPNSRLRQRLATHSQLSTLNSQPLVCYLGSIGADHGLVEAAASMKHWRAGAILVLIGPASDAMKNGIRQAAAATPGAAERVAFLGAFPHSEALALAAGADLGISLIQPNTQNWLYSAGAINKRFEYMALGLPQVSNEGPGVADILERSGCGVCVDPNQPQAIGQAVGQLLEDLPRRRAFSTNARACHLQTFNYEFQFAEVAAWIRAQCMEEGR